MSTSHRFGMIGAGGGIAASHLQAIQNIGGDLIAAADKNDSIKRLDRYFNNAQFFIEFEQFEEYLEKLYRSNLGIDFLSICTPTYQHGSHCRLALHVGANAICECPPVLNASEIDLLEALQAECNKKINVMLPFRLHPSVISLKEKVDKSNNSNIYDVKITYVKPCGPWYKVSWNGDVEKSGGITINIGFHLFDLLVWIFGDVKKIFVNKHNLTQACGYLVLEKAYVRWYLSLDYDDIQNEKRHKSQQNDCSIAVDEKVIDLSNGFIDLYTQSYENILSGNGFGLSDVRASVNLVSDIRNSDIVEPSEPYIY